MFVGTAFTIFFVPSIYLLIAKDHGKKSRAEAAAAADQPGSVASA